MCGITGWIDWNHNLKAEQETLDKMVKLLSLRGPDAQNTWLHTHAAFGHTRLVVVDPCGGHQPMHKLWHDRHYTIIYNGELYNTEDVRKVLRDKGYTFRSHSDTEVLLTAYIEWQENCLEHLNGIFAFAIWDEARQTCFIARDRLGVKPLFFANLNNEQIVFGSEIKALLAHPAIKPKVSRDGLAEIFGLGPSRSPGHGVFKQIKELRPAHYMLIRPHQVDIQRYWQVDSKPHKESLEETIEQVRALLIDSVERQLVADVPVATFLSGGIDSSAITAIAANYFQQRGEQLKTFSIDYEENEQYFEADSFLPDKDAPFIQSVQKSAQTEHHTLIIDMENLVALLKESVRVKDLPGMADIDSSLLWFCREIKRQVTVALSGECADEIFGGYPWFHRAELLARDGFPWMHSTEEREALLQDKWRKSLKLKEYVQEQYQRTLAEVPHLEGETGEAKRRRELFYLNKIWFMTTLLDRKDRMSMGASLEVRVPFADHRLVEYVWNIPWEMKMIDKKEKGILRRALQGLLPEEVLYRKKSPYPKTFHPAYTRAVSEWLNDILQQKDAPLLEFMDRGKLKELVESQGASFKTPWYGQLMTGPQLIAHLCQINYWLEHYQVVIEA